MERCRECGRGPALGQWCSECRHRARTTRPGGGTILGVGTETARAQAVPGLLWAAIGTFAGAALLGLVVTAATGATAFTLLPALVVSTVLGLLAHRLYRGSRLARALAVVVSASLLMSSLGTGVPAYVLIAIACVAACGVLVLAPTVRAFFLGPFGLVPGSPVSVALVRIVAGVLGTLSALWALGFLVGGVVALGTGSAASSGSEVGALVGGLAGAFSSLLIGLAVPLAAVAVFWFWAMTALGSGSRGARLAVTIVCGVDGLLLLLFSAGSGAPGVLLLGLALHAAIVVPLWAPSDARRHFGDVPLPAVEEWHRRTVAATSAPSGPGYPGPHPSGPFAGRAPHPSGPFPGAASRPSGPFLAAKPFPGASGPTAATFPGPPSAPAPRTAEAGYAPRAAVSRDVDPVTEPIALGRHAHPGLDGQPA